MRLGRRLDDHKRGPAHARGIVEIIEMNVFRQSRYAIKIFVLGAIKGWLRRVEGGDMISGRVARRTLFGSGTIGVRSDI